MTMMVFSEKVSQTSVHIASNSVKYNLNKKLGNVIVCPTKVGKKGSLVDISGHYDTNTGWMICPVTEKK